MARHVPPDFQAIFELLFLATLRHKLRPRRFWCASLQASRDVVGRLFAARFLLPPSAVNRGVNFRSNIPSRIWRRLLLRFLHGKLAKMGHFANLAVVAWPLSGALGFAVSPRGRCRAICGWTFCFRRWHSVHELVERLSFSGSILDIVIL
jgi:hypothetical protein